jgi:hypothetical protein
MILQRLKLMAAAVAVSLVRNGFLPSQRDHNANTLLIVVLVLYKTGCSICYIIGIAADQDHDWI